MSRILYTEEMKNLQPIGVNHTNDYRTDSIPEFIFDWLNDRDPYLVDFLIKEHAKAAENEKMR